jgi:hypothetical protein
VDVTEAVGEAAASIGVVVQAVEFRPVSRYAPMPIQSFVLYFMVNFHG